MCNLSRRLIAITMVAVCLVPVGGCGSGGVAVTPLVPVKGKVTYKGKPLTVGTVRFEPDGYGRMASGKLQSDGTFVLSTLKDGDGAAVGHHRVYVTDVDKSLAQDRAFKKYSGAASSKVEVDVDAEHTDFPLDLK
jgi:hypothetical protein